MGLMVFDCEIKKGVPRKRTEPVPGVEYCAGWEDFSGMGIACICALEMAEARRPRVFCEDNFREFQALVDRSCRVVGFNNLHFDNRLCAAHGIDVPFDKSYDLQQVIWLAAGLEGNYRDEAHSDFSLEKLCMANFGRGKSGDSALVPQLWQGGRHGLVIDHCLQDVLLTADLLDQIVQCGWVRDPRDLSKIIEIKPAIMALYWNRAPRRMDSSVRERFFINRELQGVSTDGKKGGRD
jgi:hypothetical protein